MITTITHTQWHRSNMDKRHENYIQCDLNHVYFQLVQTLFFIEINPKCNTNIVHKQTDNEMINFNFISAENPNNKYVCKS